MTTSDILLDSTHDYLLRCVQTVAEDCPKLSSSSTDLHRLRNLVMVLQSTSSSPASPPKRELTLEHAWALVSDAQSSLNSLRVAGTANPVTGYTERIGGNTGYIIHPEEIMADNFVIAIRQKKDVPNPEIPAGVIDILSGIQGHQPSPPCPARL